MALPTAAIKRLAEYGLTLEQILEVSALTDTPVDLAAEKRRAYDRERKAKAKDRNSTGNSTGTVEANSTGNSTGIPPERGLSRVRDITSNSEDTGILSLALAREWAGDALADMARAPGVASLHPLKAAMAGRNPCSLDDIEAGIRGAAAWMRGKHGPGRMQSWDLAVKMAGEARDRRIAGAPEAGAVIPLRPGTGPPSFADRIADENRQARELAMQMLENGPSR